MKVYPVAYDHARAAWPKVKKHLKPAVEMSGGRWALEYVLAGLVTGEQLLWVVVNEADDICVGAATTEIIQYPEKKFVAIHFLGGDDFAIWYQDLLGALTDYAGHTGCDGIETNARFGVWKFFKHDGFQKKSVFYEKLI